MPAFRRLHKLLINPIFIGVLLVSMAGRAAVLFAQSKTQKPLALSLESYVRLALERSLQSQSARENLSSARYSLKATSRSLTWPSLTAAGAVDRTFSDSDTGIEVDARTNSQSLSLSQPFLTGTSLSLNSDWSETDTDITNNDITSETNARIVPDFSATIEQPLYIFTGNESLRTRRQAHIQWEDAQDTFRNELLSISFDAQTRYYNLVLQQESVKVEQKKFESAKLVHNITQALVKAGKKANVELLRADIRAKTDARRIQNAESDFEKSQNQAKDFVLIPTTAPIQLVSDLTYVPLRAPLDRLLKTALEKNPSLAITRRSLELSSINLDRTREGNNLDLGLFGSYGRTRSRLNGSDPVSPYDWTVGMDFVWPFFDATQTNLAVLQGEVSLRNSHRSYEEQERTLKVDIENAYLEIKRTEEQIVDFEDNRKSARQSLAATRLQYQNGVARLTDVFDAENQLRDIDLEYLGLLVDFNTARDNLSLLVGIDINTINGKTP